LMANLKIIINISILYIIGNANDTNIAWQRI
jgi:hypothetical protein